MNINKLIKRVAQLGYCSRTLDGAAQGFISH